MKKKKKMLSLVGMVAAMIGAIVFLGAPSALVNAAGQEKVSMCHREGNGDFHIISIADPAYDTHIAHGDKDVLTLFDDLDDDGFGAGVALGIFCEVLPFTSLTDDDCDDDNADAFPGNSEVCDDVDNDCDGVVDDIPGTGCCIAAGTCTGAGCGSVDLRTACNSGASVFQTIVEGGRVSVDPLHIGVPQGTSYITFNSNVTSVRLYNCDGRQLDISASTNLCFLPGGCCNTIRWNDEICCIEVNP